MLGNGGSTSSAVAVPLCVDLDGTLIRTDVLWESVIQLWRHPLAALKALYVLCFRGKAAMKDYLAGVVSIDPASLPYREDVLSYITAQRDVGRSVVLATATQRDIAQRIADHLGVFEMVFATDTQVNLSSQAKRAALERAYGLKGFDYIGDSYKDVAVFAAARQSLLVDPSMRLAQRAESVGAVAHVFRLNTSKIKVLAKALRLHQWAKNALLVVPLLAAHQIFDVRVWVHVALAFLAFGLIASSTYLVNDLLDLSSDRQHARKRFRPLASGALSIPAGLLLAIGSATVGAAVTELFLPPVFGAYIAFYVVLTLSYSFFLKRRLMIDVLTLAVLYTLRILAGGVAVGIVVSEWLLMFSLFIFLSLAFLKRAIELAGAKSGGRLAGRGYALGDLDIVKTMGVSSGMLSVLVLALYVNSSAVTDLYHSPKILWLMCPLMIYWIARIWFLAGRDEVNHDPVVFALFDWRSYVIGALGLFIAFLAKVGVAGIG